MNEQGRGKIEIDGDSVRVKEVNGQEVRVDPTGVHVMDRDREVKVGFSGIRISGGKESGMKRIGSLLYILVCLCTAMIGHTIHGSLFWAVMDFIFMPFAWCKWLICQQVNLSIVKHTFEFFLR